MDVNFVCFSGDVQQSVVFSATLIRKKTFCTFHGGPIWPGCDQRLRQDSAAGILSALERRIVTPKKLTSPRFGRQLRTIVYDI
jgi:hypothetical protein